MRVFLLVLLSILTITVSAQERIPLGEWRMHVSYNHISDISSGDGKVFAAAQNGVVVLDKADKSFRTLHKLNSLTSAGIRSGKTSRHGKHFMIVIRQAICHIGRRAIGDYRFK